MTPPTLIDRPPRIQPALPFDEIEIPTPPNKEEHGYTQLIQVALPLLTIIAYIFIATLSGAGGSPFLIIPMALSVVASTAFSIYSYRQEKQRQVKLEKGYIERLIELNKEMRAYHDMQRRFYGYNYPDWLTTQRLVETARVEVEKAERPLRTEARVWERRATDEDFGVIRLGMGVLPSTVTYVSGNVENVDDPHGREALKLAQDSRYVTDIPVVLSLRPPRPDENEEQNHDKPDPHTNRTPATHALSIAGEPESVYEFTRALLAHYVVFHAPMDAKLFILAGRKQPWAWTDGLPHSREDEQNRLHCFVAESKASEVEHGFADDEANPLEQFLEGIRKILAQRKIQLQEHEENEGKSDPTSPFLLLVVDLLDSIYDHASPLSELESDAAISILLAEGATLGAAVIFLVPERSKAPSGCQGIIEIERTTPATNSKSPQYQKLHFRYVEVGLNTFRYVGAADGVTQPEEMTALARALAHLEVRQSFGANLASSVPFLDLMGYASLSQLEGTVRQKWQDSVLPKHANWLQVKLGLMSGNKPRTLVFSAKRDGVHGMVAGSTGSGKSELLISLITGLAVTYAPTVLNFVLVDYKGGGAFKGFEALPHCVDIITNLQGDSVTRMFTAIQSEMQRRQALNAETQTKNIVEYRQKGLHQTYRPYPYLFIIIDEFAEMIADRAEFKTQLESITRVGRAQGVSLILAAQRPSGVTDQMRSNIKFRICLRVETPGESREMLRRTDAAFLPGGIPGRGYLQVGNDEIELIQSAYTGDKYIDPARPPGPKIIWPGRSSSYDTTQDQEPPELYKAIVEMLARVAHDQQIERQLAPWPDFLPNQLYLSETLVSPDPGVKAITSHQYLAQVDYITLGQEPETVLSLNPALNRWLQNKCGWLEPLDWARYAMRPVVGLVDDPYKAKQLPLVIDLPQGHLAIFGASGWGKTTFMRSLVISLTATHSPDHLWIYILDLGGRNLSALAHLPHVGAVITPDAEGYKERVEQLWRELDNIVEARKIILNNAGVPDFYKYNETHTDAPLPAILLIIDNFIEFRETFGTEKDNVESVMVKYITLARQAKAYGLHFAISATQLNVLPSPLFSLLTERLTLKLADPTEYRTVVGGYPADIGDIPGRGYIKIETQPLSCQIAQPLGLRREGSSEAASETQELVELAQSMKGVMARSGRTYKQPVQVDALPKGVLFKQILAKEVLKKEVDAHFPNHLRTYAAQKWRDSLDSDQADWLKVILGVVSGNRPRELYLAAKEDGVHGMIAGGTGSGKSELLMTLIVGLALNYDPTVLNFVLVDYKGGGAFKPFETLPHCIDSLTNLNKSAVKRMFTAINAEMQRRQKLNTDTDTKEIVEYRRKGLHLTHAPYPHLFIIIDEYAEMITNNPEFKDELDSITRLGRAQGVNLLLASQRPIGVTDQMRANIKYRICLRVEGEDTSREMLRRSDAAFLPNGMPGRGYLQVGNENIELIQVAYTGETYLQAGARDGNKEIKFYDGVVDLANDLLHGERPRTPWPPPLKPKFTLADPLIESYLTGENDKALITLGHTGRVTCLNPFIQEWFAGRVAWRGMKWGETAMRAIVGLVDDPYHARQLPLIVDLNKGHVVLFGAPGWGKTTFIRSLIVSLAATHSPAEFHAHIFDLGGRNLEVLTNLPHVGTLVMPDEQGYEERVQQLLRELNDVVDARKQKFSKAGVSTLAEYNRSQPGQIEPAILVVVDNFAEFITTFGDTSKRGDEDNLLAAFISLARQAKAFGLHFVITINRLNMLSNNLYSLFTERLTLRLAEADEYGTIMGGALPEIDEIPGRGYVKIGRNPLEFQTALAAGEFDAQGQLSGEIQAIRRLGRQMQELGQGAWLGQEPLRIGALPKSSSYRELLTQVRQLNPANSFLAELKMSMRWNWTQTALAGDHVDWLKVTLGIISGNKPRTLHLAAKADGVHAMIAGGTGSGKSEMLMTLIVGLAVDYPPDILNFVLVDYKGGGAFKPFEKLPHCVDSISNLNKAAVNRMFTAINAEMRRRQKLNADTGTKDIIEYRRKGLHLTFAPYPHLFIIIDEYAEMISDSPDYKNELESITRVGRAQGVNLLLASQRPVGVTDQMRANIKLRLCLRVEQIDTSREMLRRPDAAFLPNGVPGRGYLQVGNENIELIQVSYTGEPQPDDRPAPVCWPERSRLDTEPVGDDVPKLYDAVVQLARELVEGRMAPKPWPAFLPNNFSLQSPLYDAQHNQSFTLTTAVSDWLNGDTESLWPGVDWQKEALRPVLGLLDDPAEARQESWRLNLNRNHLAVFGDPGMGKTAFLRTLIVSLAATHSPNELHIYILDLGGRNFRGLEALPHIGRDDQTSAVIYADEDAFAERLRRLLEKLDRMIKECQQLLSQAGCSRLADYNELHPAQALPAVLVVIDNFAELNENYEFLVDETIIPLVRQGLNVGLTFVISGNTPSNMPNKLFSLVGERVTFKQSNPDRYQDIVGRGAIELEDTPGRGYVRKGRQPLLFHAALPVGIFSQMGGRDLLGEANELERLGQQMQAAIRRGEFALRNRPDPIKILPEWVSLDDMLQLAPPRLPRLQAVLGQNYSLQPALVDLKRLGPHFVVVGPPLSGKTTVLYNWVFSLADRYPPEQVGLVLIDFQRKFVEYGGAHQLAELPHVLAAPENAEQLAALLPALEAEGRSLAGQKRPREIFVIIDNFEDFNEEIEQERSLPGGLATLARRYGREGLHFIISGALGSSSTDLQRIVQASGYGLGLRTGEAVDRLGLERRPPELGSKELAVGRSYMVKSGQATLVQVASPYQTDPMSLPVSETDEDTEMAAPALDRWVERIQARYPGQQTSWSLPDETPAEAAPPAGSQKLRQVLGLLQRAALQEMERLQKINGLTDLMTPRLLQLNADNPPGEMELMALAREALLQKRVADGIDETLVQELLSVMDDEAILLEFEDALNTEPDLDEEEIIFED